MTPYHTSGRGETVTDAKAQLIKGAQPNYCVHCACTEAVTFTVTVTVQIDDLEFALSSLIFLFLLSRLSEVLLLISMQRHSNIAGRSDH